MFSETFSKVDTPILNQLNILLQDEGIDLEEFLSYELPINENFYSIQGEGASSGHPSYFIRLNRCNLHCSWCDSKRTWKASEKVSINTLIRDIVSKPVARIVLTGGEPILHQNNKYLVALLKVLKHLNLALELETSGSIKVKPKFIQLFDQINISPKLSNSECGIDISTSEGLSKYLNALNTYHLLDGASPYYKFVISSKDVQAERDLHEIENLINSLRIPLKRIYLMPEGETMEKQRASMEKVVNYCLALGVNFCPRVHVMVWDNKHGV